LFFWKGGGMGATKGNQFWKLADPDKIGRPRIFDTPKDLWNCAVEYFTECDKNPIVVEETTTTAKGKFRKKTKHKVPYTWEGLYIFIEVCNLDHYKKNKEFSGILTHIGNIIRNQKYTGAAVGIFNANLIARDIGLKEKTENKNENTHNFNITVQDKETKEGLDKLKE
jgi:hypothetical protein